MANEYSYSGYGMPRVDFSILGDLGNTYTTARNEQSLLKLADLFAQGRQPDLNQAAAIAAGAGRPDLASQFLTSDELRRQHAIANAHISETERLARDKFAEEKRQFDEGLNKPISVAPGAALVSRTGQTIREPSTDALLDETTMGQMADQYLAGDTSVLTNLGRGAQGAQNVVALRREIARRAGEGGLGGADVAQKNAEYFGTKAGQRTLGTRTANMELAVNEAQKLAPLVLETSNAVDRTKYPKINDIILAYEKGTGDENVVRYGAALNSFVNVYARAISPTGNPHVSDKDHAREILQMGFSQGQINAAMDQLMKEMAAAREAPSAVKQQMREQATGNSDANRKAAAAAKLRATYKSNPRATEQYDEVFGPGEAARVLGVTQ